MWVQAAIMAAQAISGMIDKQDAEHKQFKNDVLANAYQNSEIRTEQLNTFMESSRRVETINREELSLRGKVATHAVARGIGGEAVEQAIRQVGKEANNNRADVEQQVASYTRSAEQRANSNHKQLIKAYNKLTFNSTFDFIHDAAAPAVMMAYLGEMASNKALDKTNLETEELNNQLLDDSSQDWNMFPEAGGVNT